MDDSSGRGSRFGLPSAFAPASPSQPAFVRIADGAADANLPRAAAA